MSKAGFLAAGRHQPRASLKALGIFLLRNNNFNLLFGYILFPVSNANVESQGYNRVYILLFNNNVVKLKVRLNIFTLKDGI